MSASRNETQPKESHRRFACAKHKLISRRLSSDSKRFDITPTVVRVAMCAATVAFLSSCTNLANTNRDYTLAYDATSGMVMAGGRITGAEPGKGRASLGWQVTANTGAAFPNILNEQPVLGREGKAVIKP